MNEISDEDIVRMFHSGNGEEKAFRLLVGKYSERLYWHIRKIVIGMKIATMCCRIPLSRFGRG